MASVVSFTTVVRNKTHRVIMLNEIRVLVYKFCALE